MSSGKLRKEQATSWFGWSFAPHLRVSNDLHMSITTSFYRTFHCVRLAQYSSKFSCPHTHDHIPKILSRSRSVASARIQAFISIAFACLTPQNALQTNSFRDKLIPAHVPFLVDEQSDTLGHLRLNYKKW